MNVGLSFYGFMWLLVVFVTQGVNGQDTSFFWSLILVIGSLSALVNGVKGYAYRVKGYNWNGKFSYTTRFKQLLLTQTLDTIIPTNKVGTGTIGVGGGSHRGWEIRYWW